MGVWGSELSGADRAGNRSSPSGIPVKALGLDNFSWCSSVTEARSELPPRESALCSKGRCLLAGVQDEIVPT